MEIGVQEAARRLGVSQRRVQALAFAGRVPARRVSGVWLIDPAGLSGVRRRSRPMSDRIGAALVALLSEPGLGASALGISPREMSRLRGRLRTLVCDEDPGSLIAAWTANRAAPIALSAHRDDLPALREDPRLVLTGVSDERSHLVAISEVEARVHRDDVDAVLAEHFLVAAGEVNVRLRVEDFPPARPTPVGVVIADLSAQPDDRSRGQVERLVRKALERR